MGGKKEFWKYLCSKLIKEALLRSLTICFDKTLRIISKRQGECSLSLSLKNKHNLLYRQSDLVIQDLIPGKFSSDSSYDF